MITPIRLLSTIAIAAFALTAVACVANPTPHPGSGDNSGMGMADNATDGAFAAAEAEGGGAASESDEMAVDNAPEPNGPTSAQGADSGSEVEGDAIAPDDASPDGESDPCEGPSVDFLSELMSYQGCASDDECQLLIDENSCECTRAIAVSDLEGAQALLDGALLCAEAADDVLGPCIADAAPTGNVAFWQPRSARLRPRASLASSRPSPTPPRRRTTP